MSIQVTNLLKEYGQQKAVNGISFQVARGEIVGFLGPNGAGKSTTMKILTGYLQQTAGEAFVCGLNVSAEPLRSKKLIGYLPELNALYYDMYVREYLGFVAEVHGLKNIREAVGRVLGIVKLETEASKKIGQLSKGYKQRVGLAAALIHDPEVLILDEPTSGLDPNQIIEIREVIRRQGDAKTVLFSSHILQEVEAICDRVIIINKGELVADDRLSNLQQRTGAASAVMVQFQEALSDPMLLALNGLPAVKSAGSLTQPGSYRIDGSDAAAIRKQVFEFSNLHDLNIISLQTGSQTLEEVFRNLTGK